MSDNKLTADQVDQILCTMDEEVDKNENLRVLANLPSNNGVEHHEPEEGYEEEIKCVIDNNGAIIPTKEEDDDNLDYLDDDLTFDEMVERASKNIKDEVIDITPEDITKQVKDEEILKDTDLSDDDVLQILNVTNRYQNKENFNVFKALPQVVQTKINQFIGVGDNIFSASVNSSRNDIAELLIHDFISNISMEKFTQDYNRELEALQNKMDEEISKMWMDYSENRTKYIESAIENETDPSKREVIAGVLDAINEGYTLERVKRAAKLHKIKIKKFDIEKPSRVFSGLMDKYKDSTQNIYSIYTSYEILENHMKDIVEDKNDVCRFFIAICKVCLNYRVDNPVEHAFMYYALYNPILLNVYKGEDYEKFSKTYFDNVLEIIKLLKEPTAEAVINNSIKEAKKKNNNKKK